MKYHWKKQKIELDGTVLTPYSMTLEVGGLSSWSGTLAFRNGTMNKKQINKLFKCADKGKGVMLILPRHTWLKGKALIDISEDIGVDTHTIACIFVGTGNLKLSGRRGCSDCIAALKRRIEELKDEVEELRNGRAGY